MDTILSEKEIFGMLSDDYKSNYWNEIETCFKNSIASYFGDEMKLLYENFSPNTRAWFDMKYLYLPKYYNIEIGGEYLQYWFLVFDKDGARTELHPYYKYSSLEYKSLELSKKNVNDAVRALKLLLEREDISFFYFKDNKRYEKTDDGMKRVKRWNLYENIQQLTSW